MATEQLNVWPVYFQECIKNGLQHWQDHPPQAKTDHANFQKIVDFGSRGKGTQKQAAQIALKNFGFIQNHRTYQKWIETLKGFEEISDPKLNTKIGTMLGLLHWHTGDYSSAESILLKTHQKTINDQLKVEELQVRYALCLTYWATNQLLLAEKHIQFVVDAQFDSNNLLRKFTHYSALGIVKLAQMKIDHAKKIFSTCIQIAKEVKNATLIGQAYNNMAVFHLQQKQYRESLNFYGQAAAMFEISENASALYQIEIIRAWLHLLLGNTTSVKAAQERIAAFESIVENDLLTSQLKQLQLELERAIQE